MAPASRKRHKSASRPGQPLPGRVWQLGGHAIGLGVAGYFYLQAQHRTPAAAPAAHVPAPAAAPPAKHAEKKNATADPAAAAAAAKPRFDFYTILPEMEVVVPEAQKSARPSGVDKNSVYLLQIGSFRSFAEADSLKARLALLGVESKIETVSSGDKEVWHRVRVGPYSDPRELNKIRTRLLNNNINAILMQVKG